MAISPLWCSLMRESLFYTLMMEVKDVGEIIDKSMHPDATRFRLRRNVSGLNGLGMHQLSCVGTFVVVDGNVKQYSYIDLMGVNLLESVQQMFRDQQHPFVFQQDNAPCHRAMAVLTWFENNARRNMLFSPQSPYVNHVKNIWSCMKKDA